MALRLDEAPGHRAANRPLLAAPLDIVRIWLPQPWAECNAMDQLWRELKGHIAAHSP
jgi:hypothetical protein